MTRDRTSDLQVLLIEPDGRVRQACADALRRTGFAVLASAASDGALELMDTADFDVIVSDIGPPESMSAELLGAIREREPDLPVILFTSEPRLDTAMLAVNLGAYRYLVKPLQAERFTDVVHRAALLRRLARLRHEAFAAVETEDPQLHEIAERFTRALHSAWIAYQPIVDTRRRSLAGVEALLRIRTEGFSGVEQFLATAQRLDRSSELGRAVRGLIAADVPQLPPGVSIFVNLLPNDLLDPELYEDHLGLGPYAPRVVLELTERAPLEVVPDLGRRIRTLRALGYRIALDDLGAGYSGLASLTQLEPDIVKLDRSLIRGVHQSARRRAVVRSMVTLCRSLEVDVIGEGVEWRAEAEALTRLEVRQQQGFLFARPERPLTWRPDALH